MKLDVWGRLVLGGVPRYRFAEAPSVKSKGAGTKERPLRASERKAGELFGMLATNRTGNLQRLAALRNERKSAARWSGVMELVAYDASQPIGFHAARRRLLSVLAHRR